MKNKSTLPLALSLLLTQCLSPLSAMAVQISHGTPTPNTNNNKANTTSPLANLNLSSTKTSERAQGAGTIIVGGATRQVSINQLITPAERVALSQVLGSGGQQILLGALGNATGGYFNVSASAGGGASSLVIPKGVTGVNDVSRLANLNITGNLVNAGTLQFLSQSAAVNSAVVSAMNITNQSTGVITSVLPTNGVAGFLPALSTVHLTLNASQSLVNYGLISSSGNLTINAPTVTNKLPAGTTGATPTISAVNNLSIFTNTLTNAGSIVSQTGNINVSAVTAANTIATLNINGAGGTMQALNGAINIGDLTNINSTDINLSGGDYFSPSLNFFAGPMGQVIGEVGQVSGTVNADCKDIRLHSTSPQLTLGTINYSDDPLITNTVGFDLYILEATVDGDISLQSLGNIIAQCDIISNTGQVNLDARLGITTQNITAATFVTLHSGDASVGIVPNVDPAGDITVMSVNGPLHIAMQSDAGLVNYQHLTSQSISLQVNTPANTPYAPVLSNLSFLPARSVGVSIVNTGAGGIVISDSLTVPGGTKFGGKIDIEAPVGTVTVNGATLTAQTPTSVGFSSGNIIISGQTVNLTNCVLQANGDFQNNAGAVTVYSRNNLNINGNVLLKATGGGGIIDVMNTSTQGPLTIGGGGTLEVNADGRSGADIAMTAGIIQIANSVAVNLHANGCQDGTNTISVAETVSPGDLFVGVGPGMIQLSANSDPNSSGGMAGMAIVQSTGNLTAQAAGISAAGLDGNATGGYIQLEAGYKGALANLSVSGDLSTNGSGTGNGGSIYLMATGNINSTSPSGASHVTANGGSSGNGGVVQMTTTSGDISIGGASSPFLLSATGGSSGSSSGNGGYIEVDAGGNLTVLGSDASDVRALGAQGNGGTLAFVGGYHSVNNGIYSFNPAGTLNIAPGTYAANGAGGGNGGKVIAAAPTVITGTANGTVNLQAMSGATGTTGGSILVQSANGDISMTSTDLNASSTLGTGGTVTVSSTANLNASGCNVDVSSQNNNAGTITFDAGANVNITNSSSFDVGSQQKNAGQVTIAAGTIGTGNLSMDASIFADAGTAGTAGTIALGQNSPLAMQIGALQQGGLPGSGLISAVNTNGIGGTLTLTGGANNLNVAINQTINLNGNTLDNLGTINATSSNNVSFTGPGTVTANFNGTGQSYSVTLDGAGSTLGVKTITATTGNATVKATALDGQLVFAANSSVNAPQGAVEIGAPSMHFRGNSTLTMDTAGVLKVNSGNQTSSLAMDFATGSTVTFNVTQGGSLRPGVIQIGPNGVGALTMSGTASLNFTGGTVSMVSNSGSITLGSGLSLSSDVFDTTQNIGMEIVATNGNVNLNSAVSARQLNISTVGSGSINLASEINSPTVVLSVQGTGSINQTGAGTVGIGTLVMSSQNGNIGSAGSPINANVLELQVNSTGGSAYVANASTVDIKTSNIAGTFQLNNNGDVSIESTVTTNQLSVTAAGNITMFANTSGTTGVSMAVSGTGSEINVASGANLSASGGTVSLNTDSLVLDGNITAGSGANVTAVSGDLSLTGASGHITLTAGNILLSGNNSVTFGSSYILNAGTGGSVQIQTGSLSSGGVTLLSGVSLTSSSLNVFTNLVMFNSGSSVTLTSGGSGMNVQSTGGAPLTVTSSGAIAINATGGGAVQFTAGVGGALTFQGSGVGTSSLNVVGGQLFTTSSAADTNLSNCNLSSSKNIQVSVNGANLNLNGNITSSQSGGVIVLQDPDSITINGNGTVGFAAGLSGSIIVQATSANAGLTITGNPIFNAGTGSVSFTSTGTITFASGATPTINGGATVNIDAPTIVFGAQSQVVASGASNINISGNGSSSVDLVVPDGSTATISTGGGLINVSAAAGSPINFNQDTILPSTATLNFVGGDTNITTQNANVTINPNVVLHFDHNLNIQTPGGTLINNGQIQTPQTTTIIQASGPLTINQNVTAYSLIIRTTANNGNITLAANVNVTKDLTVSAIGSGTITQTSGLLSAQSITLMSATGSIGSLSGRIQVATGDLSVSTTGAAYVNAQGPVTVDSYTVGGGLNLTATGNISIGAANASTVTLSSNGTFNAGPSGTVSVNAASQISFGSNINLTVQSSSLSLNAPNISIGSGSSKNTITSAGPMTINGNVTAATGIFTTTSGNITFNGSVTGSNLTVKAGGTGNVTAVGGTISAPTLDLESGAGNVGSALTALSISTTNLITVAGGNGIVNLSNNSSSMTVDKSSAGGNFSLSSSGALNVGAITTGSGSISLSSGAALNVLGTKNGVIAHQGNVTISSNTSINVNKSATVEALSTNKSNGLGNMWIVIGSVPATPVKGTAPAGMTVSQKTGGVVYFGTNGITAASKGKAPSANAWGSNLVFSTGSQPASAIFVDAGAYLLADPPSGIYSAPTMRAAGVQTTFVSTTTSHPENAAHLSMPAAQPVMNSVNSITTALYVPSLIPGTVPVNTAVLDATQRNKKADASESSLKAIACVTGATEAALRPAAIVHDDIVERSVNAHGSMYTKGSGYAISSESIELHKGEMLINARRHTELKSAGVSIHIADGTSALVKSDGHNIEIFNLYDTHPGAVKVVVSGRELTLCAGQRVLIGSNGSHVAVRNEKPTRVSDKMVNLGEFPLMSLISNSDLLAKLVHSDIKEDRQIASRLFKMAACLTVVTSSHGAYLNRN